ncbi:calcium:proton antiporter [Neiella sp. HB171785]|uniref:Calcium:proton antiporter n=1 Tax=Neiella litorisoli TaxID=2771431 RepID=A0A8J6R3I9_9GAMM|nr:calcium:proton antiporter [Neiella litorisoli]MBD1390415.1 calcium:proton antiporter [Neiella litorisoli]
MIKQLKQDAALVFGIITMVLFYTLGQSWLVPLSDHAVAIGLFTWLLVTMLWCAFKVVRHADALAVKLGEPYGTLVLTLTVTAIEVSLISAVMLTGKANPLLARDTMMAVVMIVMNGLVGASLLLGGLKHSEQEYQLEGTRAFLTVITPLVVIALVLPSFTTSTADPSYTSGQQLVFGAMTIALFGVFLAMQTMQQKHYFVQPIAAQLHEQAGETSRRHLDNHGVLYHTLMLLVTITPIVLLSKKLGTVMDFGIVELQLPVALSGILIAAIVLTPEGLAALKAARNNQLQRSINICLGSVLATIGLTVPAVLTISLFVGQPVTLGLGPTGIILIMLTLFSAALTFGGTKTSILQGAVHIALFLMYLILIFAP